MCKTYVENSKTITQFFNNTVVTNRKFVIHNSHPY